MFDVMQNHFQDKKVKVLEDRLLAGLSEDEDIFFQAVEIGNLNTIKEMIENDKVKVDCFDQLGRTGLEIAVCGDDPDVVAYLLEKSSSKNIHKALIAATDNDMDRMCDLLMDHPMYQQYVKQHSERMAMTMTAHCQEKVSDKKNEFSNERLKQLLLEVLIRAAKRNNFQIVRKILTCGIHLEEPHDFFCNCKVCKQGRAEDFKVFTTRRLDTFAALASPAYICLTSEDPVSQAFSLSSKFRQLADQEQEYKGYYTELDQQVQDFTTEVLDQCHTSDEVKFVLSAKQKNPETEDDEEEEDDGSVLHLMYTAVALEQKKFVAHPQCQVQVGELWYSGVPELRVLNKTLNLAMAIPVGCLLCPVFALLYIFLPRCSLLDQVTRLLATPSMKFLSFTCSYLTFLGLCVYAKLELRSFFDSFACPQPEPKAFIFVFIIFLNISGKIFDECVQIYETGAKEYMGSFWNMMDSIMLSLLCTSFTLDVVAPAAIKNAEILRFENSTYYHDLVCQQAHYEEFLTREAFCNFDREPLHYEVTWEPEWVPDPQLVADLLFSIGILLSVCRFSFIMPVNEALGTMLVSFMQCCRDVAKTAGMFFLIIIAFTCSISAMYAPNTCLSEKFYDFRSSLITLTWAMLGFGEEGDAKFVSDNKPLAVYSLTNKHVRADDAEIFGLILYGVYSFVMIVVLLNLLIAIMSTSYMEVEEQKEVEWKFARTELWLTFTGEDGLLSPPYNVIPIPRLIWDFFKNCCCAKKPSEEEKASNERVDDLCSLERNEGAVAAENKLSRQDTMRMLIRRYVVFSEKRKTEGENGESINGEEVIKKQLDKLSVKMEKRMVDMAKKFSMMDADLTVMEKDLHSTQAIDRDHMEKLAKYAVKKTDDIVNLRNDISGLSKEVDETKIDTKLVQEQSKEHLDKFVEFVEKKNAESGEYGNLLEDTKLSILKQIDSSSVQMKAGLQHRISNLTSDMDTSVLKLSHQVEKVQEAPVMFTSLVRMGSMLGRTAGFEAWSKKNKKA